MGLAWLCRYLLPALCCSHFLPLHRDWNARQANKGLSHLWGCRLFTQHRVAAEGSRRNTPRRCSSFWKNPNRKHGTRLNNHRLHLQRKDTKRDSKASISLEMGRNSMKLLLEIKYGFSVIPDGCVLLCTPNVRTPYAGISHTSDTSHFP